VPGAGNGCAERIDHQGGVAISETQFPRLLLASCTLCLCGEIRLRALKFPSGPCYLPTRMIWPSGFVEPPLFSTLIANAAADSIGAAGWKLVRISPLFGTDKTPALTG